MKKFGFLVAGQLHWLLGSVQAEAARMGGGKSVGRQSCNVTQREARAAAQRACSQQSATNAAAAEARNARTRRRCTETSVGRDARRPGRRPGPGLARTARSAWVPPSATSC